MKIDQNFCLSNHKLQKYSLCLGLTIPGQYGDQGEPGPPGAVGPAGLPGLEISIRSTVMMGFANEILNNIFEIFH